MTVKTHTRDGSNQGGKCLACHVAWVYSHEYSVHLWGKMLFMQFFSTANGSGNLFVLVIQLISESCVAQ